MKVNKLGNVGTVLAGISLLYVLALHVGILWLVYSDDLTDRVRGVIGIPVSKPTHYDHMVAFHLRVDQNVPPGAVLFFGDSHIQGLAVSAVSELGVNFGIGGDTTAGLLDRLRKHQSLEQAKAVVVAVGLNDFKFGTIAETYENIIEIIESIPSTTRVILCAVLPVDENIARKEYQNKLISELNSKVRNLAHNYANVDFLDVGTEMSKDGNLLFSNHVGDGVHLNPQGYSIWIAAIKNKLAEH